MARKKRGGYGRVNLLQPLAHESTHVQPLANESTHVQNGSSDSSTSASTLSSSSTNSSTSPESDDQTQETNTDATTLDDEQLLLLAQAPEWLSNHHWKLPLNGPPATNFERLRIKYHFDIRDLSVLTSFNIGKSTMLAISENPELLTTLLGSQMQSYLQYIPSRYGHEPYLTAVVDCVSAKVHSKLYPRNDMFEGMILKMYAKALASLQCAVSGDESSLDPDLLCAIQMLSLHEVGIRLAEVSQGSSLLTKSVRCLTQLAPKHTATTSTAQHLWSSGALHHDLKRTTRKCFSTPTSAQPSPKLCGETKLATSSSPNGCAYTSLSLKKHLGSQTAAQ